MQQFIKMRCQTGIKKILFALMASTTFACTKENTEGQSDLMFQSLALVTEGVSNGEIKATATVVGPNLCYQLTHFEVFSNGQDGFDIYEGIVPGRDQVCAQALYRKDTTVSIAKPAPGTYMLNFWNPNRQLFKSETVIVNC